MSTIVDAINPRKVYFSDRMTCLLNNVKRKSSDQNKLRKSATCGNFMRAGWVFPKIIIS